MTTKLKKAIPAVLVHCEGDKEYRVRGNILGINESAGTVSMQFAGHKNIEHGIPMSSIYLNEGIIDSLKDLGGKIKAGVAALVRKIKGYIFPVKEDGSIDHDVMGVGVNIAAAAAKGELPAGMTFYPSRTVIDYAKEQGTVCPVPDYDMADSAAERETAGIEKYWSTVMKNYVANESADLHEVVKAVNESYVKKYNARRRKSRKLNEAVWSLENPPANRQAYGDELSLEGCVQRVYENIMEQMEREPDDPMPRPIVIWGAPGIGKTTIIRNMIKMIKEEDGLDLMYLEISCANLNYEDWGLPTTASREDIGSGKKLVTNAAADEVYTTAAPQHWLPVFEHSGTPAEIKAKDDYFNSGRFFHGDKAAKTYDGGILFFDELTQLPQNAAKVMQALAGQRAYMGKTLASKWAIVYASNRYEDIDRDDVSIETFYWDDPQKGRYDSITYVPRLEEWLAWAEQKNPKTGRANVDKMFTNFIRQGGKHLWYDALAFLDSDTPGSRDNMLDADQQKTIQSMKSGGTKFDYDTIRDEILHDPAIRGTGVWTGREWEAAINAGLHKTLKRTVFRKHPELYNSIFGEDGSVDRTKLKDALNMLSPREWAKVAIKDYDPTGTLDRLAVVDNMILANIKGHTGEKSVVYQDWQTYTSYRRVFTPDVIECIWETGQMPPMYQADDDKWYKNPVDYRNSEASRWKSSTPTATEVIRFVIEGGITDELVDLIHKELGTGDVPKLAPAAEAAAVKKWQKAGTVGNGTKKYSVLIPNGEENSIQAKAIAATLEYSKAARRMFNAAVWCAKCALQGGVQNGGIGQTIMGAFGVHNSKIANKFDQTYHNESAIFSRMAKLSAAIEANAKNGVNVSKAQISKLTAETVCDCLSYPAYAIGQNLAQIDGIIVKKGEYK